MRTLILLGTILIADAINKNWVTDNVVPFMVILLSICMFIDTCEFINKMKNK